MSPPAPPLVVVVEGHRIVRASREHLFAYIARSEHLPRFGAPLWLTADLEERRGGEPLVTLRGYFAGLPAEAVVRTTARSPHSVDITQIRGTLRAFSQRFTIEAGDEATLLGCRVEADPGIPMLSDEAVKHFLVQYVERMLDRVRLAAERRAPSRRPLRPPAQPEGGMAADGADADNLTVAEGTVSGTQELDRGVKGPPALASAPEVAPTETQRPSGPAEKSAAPDIIPPSSTGGPSGVLPSRSRPARGPGFQRPASPPRDAASRGLTPAAQTPTATPGTATGSSTTPQGPGGSAAPGRAHRRRRRRRRRGRGSGNGGLGTDPGAAGPASGNPTESAGS